MEIPSTSLEVPFTDCSACLNLAMLPCGHLVCPLHLHGYKDRNPACPSCGFLIPVADQAQTNSELADQLGRDPILQDIAVEVLAGPVNVFCLACPNKVAARVCLDCGEIFCDVCSLAHEVLAATKDHVQQDLPQTLHNAPMPVGVSQTSPKEDIISASPPQDIQLPHSNDKEAFREEVMLFQEEVNQLIGAVTVLEDASAQLQKMKKRLERQQQLMAAYVTRLDTLDDAFMANACAVLHRLRRVREDCRPPSEAALSKLTQDVNCLLQPEEKSTGEVPRSEVTVDPMTSVPTRMFVTSPSTKDDSEEDGPWITCVVATPTGRLVMTDNRNKMVKVAELHNSAAPILTVKLDTWPYRLALLPDGQVAVTADRKCLYYLDVSHQPVVVSHVQTAREYWGVGSLVKDDTLVVSCLRDRDGPARVDVITKAGDLVKTVLDRGLTRPVNLCVLTTGQVLVSDCEADTVLRVDVHSGRDVGTLKHPDLKYPWQVAEDRAGNWYMASRDGQCVLVVTPSGQWRRLLVGKEDGDTTRVKPWGLCVTGGWVIVTWDDMHSDSVVAGYKLQ